MIIRIRQRLITGASSGIGAAMAEALAQRGCSIILSPRDAARLEARTAQLRQAYNVNVAVVTADLSQPQGALDLHAEIVHRGLAVDLLVNNAGFGLTGPFDWPVFVRAAVIVVSRCVLPVTFAQVTLS